MKINDFIEINKNLNIYEIVYSAATATMTAAAFASPAAFAAATTAAVTAAEAAIADRSAGIGKILDLDDSWIRIKWLKNEPHKWWYKTQDIQQSFHVIDNNSILRLLYE